MAETGTTRRRSTRPSRKGASRKGARAKSDPSPVPVAADTGPALPHESDLARALAATERSLLASEERFHAFLDTSPVIAFQKDDDGRYVYANERFETALGLPREGWRGRTDFELWPSDVGSRLRRNDQAVVARDRGDRSFENVTTPDGREHTWIVYRFPLRDQTGQRHLGVMCLDVTDLRHTEQALQATQERLERVLSSSPTVLYALAVENEGLGLTWVSRNVTPLLGYTVDEALEPGWWGDNVHPDDRSGVTASLSRLFADGHLTHEYRLGHRDGTFRWIRDELRLRRDAKGRPVEIFGSWADITQSREAEQVLRDAKAELEARVQERTAELRSANERLEVELAERRRAEEASRESEERLHILAQATNDAIWDRDVASGQVWWNQGVQTLFGYSPSQVGSDAAWMLDHVHPTDRERVELALAAVMEGSSQSWSLEYRFRRADGTDASVLDRGHVQRNEDGTPRRLVGAMLDITERRRAEEALHDAHDRLQAQVAELEQRNAEMEQFGEMGQILQSCRAAREAYDAVQQYAPRLFRGESGALYVFASSARGALDLVGAWGPEAPRDGGFEPDECWALRRGRLHHVEADGGVRCQHVDPEVASGHLCVPMMAQGEALGVLHLRTSTGFRLEESQRNLAQMIADSLGLGIANLRLRDALESQAIRDPLTGLFNRRFMEEALLREIRRAARRIAPLAVVMMDLDHFKQLNDTLGHDAGDAILRELGLYLQNHVRSADVACRYGGEEITLILPDATLAQARQRAEELREAIGQISIRDRGRTIGPVTVSIGVSAFPEHGSHGDELLRAADAALYAAKAGGRDRVAVAPNP